jgi:D-inositol-3-phosphate glycosyltransferase
MGEMSDRAAPPRARVAVISLHTSPLDQPGSGDSGGMNVEIRAVGERLGAYGMAVDVYTRCAGRGVPEVEPLGPMARVIQVPAGPCAPVEKTDLPGFLPRFVDAVLDRAEAEGRYDLVHAHYWLSGPAGAAASARWGVPLVTSFHTLGKVKNLSEEDGEPPVRLRGEGRAIAASDLILVPTAEESRHLAGLYGADPARIRVVPPGVDAARFAPSGSPGRRNGPPTALFVGRLQPMKGPDVAIRAVAEARRRAPAVAGNLRLVIIGGAGGAQGPDYVDGLRRLAAGLGIEGDVRFIPPVPHDSLPEVYSSADVLIMPSRSESFGLAGLEAQACGLPVIGASVGGLRTVVDHGWTGFLVEGQGPSRYADRLIEVLSAPALAARLSAGARARALRFSWDRTVRGVLDAYGELLPHRATVARAG